MHRHPRNERDAELAYEVVGVVGDTLDYAKQVEPQATFYRPMVKELGIDFAPMFLVVRAEVDPVRLYKPMEQLCCRVIARCVGHRFLIPVKGVAKLQIVVIDTRRRRWFRGDDIWRCVIVFHALPPTARISRLQPADEIARFTLCERARAIGCRHRIDKIGTGRVSELGLDSDGVGDSAELARCVFEAGKTSERISHPRDL